MTPESQRIAIAEACGWIDCAWTTHLQRPLLMGTPAQDAHPYPRQLPDYLNDLNAMHEAEKVLTNANWFTYLALLHDNVVLFPMRIAVHATASQRAEAFLKTIGKWVD